MSKNGRKQGGKNTKNEPWLFPNAVLKGNYPFPKKYLLCLIILKEENKSEKRSDFVYGRQPRTQNSNPKCPVVKNDTCSCLVSEI